MKSHTWIGGIAAFISALSGSPALADSDADKRIEKCVEQKMNERNILERIVDRVAGMDKAREAVALKECERKEALERSR
jgi:hypothetical protein